MLFANFKVRTKLLFGFLLVALLVIVAGFVGINSSQTIFQNCEDLSEHQSEALFVEEKLNDHYVWVNGLAEQLLNDVEFSYQLDPTQCGFGKWYYEFIKSPEFMTLPPNIQQLLLNMEEPHRHLHETGSEIKASFADVDLEMSGLLTGLEAAHLRWIDSLQDSWRDNDRVFSSTTDPTQCAFGKWYYSFKGTDEYNKLPQNIRDIFVEIEPYHDALHRNGEYILNLAGADGKITDPIQIAQAEAYYEANIRTNADEVISRFHEIRDFVDEKTELKNGAIEIYTTRTHDSVEELVGYFKEYQEYLHSEVEKYWENAIVGKNVAMAILITTIIVALSVAVLVGLFISYIITKPLGVLEKGCLRIQENDMTVKIPDEYVNGNDELSILAKGFSTMVANMQTFIGGVKNSAESAASAAEELSASSEEVNASMEQVSSTVQEIAKGAQTVSSKSDEAQKASKVTSESAKTGSESAKEVDTKMGTISTSTKEGADKIKQLGEKSKEIGNIVETINGISEQTNLLALNAAIEAARAGDAGRGFAVVADEVRKLAEETGKATQQISDLIGGIQSEIQSSVEAMDKNTGQVDEGSASVKKALESFNAIPDLVGKVNSALEEMAGAAQENAAGSEQVSSSIQQVGAAMQQVASAAQNLSTNADELKKLVSKFKV